MNTLLSSWKEIANHLNKGVRTVQRWEADGLPVRRPDRKSLGVVMAMSNEIEIWMQSRRVVGTTPVSKCNALRLSCHESIETSQNLRLMRRTFVHDIEEQQIRLKAELDQLRANCRTK